jgi:UDP-N-acetylmuramoyl-L-alanyl-D-glutamate--2,6-diaminopimelate ligase
VRLSELAAQIQPCLRAAPTRSQYASPADPVISGVTEDSRRVSPGLLFVAVPGAARDGHDFLADAISRGAAAVVVERQDCLPRAIPALVVSSSREALAQLSAAVHGHSARSLTLVGFTGTFGKTSTSEILRALLDAAGLKPAVIGSLGARYGGFVDRGTGLTTPSPPELHACLARLRDAGARQVIMEVTTHALRMGRVSGLQFDGGLIAAIMPGEHTDFHRTYEDYVDAKRLFLRYLSSSALLAFDADNRAARQLASEARVERTFGFTIGRSADDHSNDLAFRDVLLDGAGALFTVQHIRIRSALLGRAHVRNVALALTYALASGVTLDAARTVLADLRPLRRRMERYDAGGRTVVDDTAAHPDSLDAVFEAAALLPHDRLWVVFAIRGNRGADINRRNAVALARLAALHGADGVVLTASADVVGPNDRATPEEIDAVRAAYEEHGGRAIWYDALESAIGEVVALSAPGDLVLLLGAQSMDEGKRLLSDPLDLQ